MARNPICPFAEFRESPNGGYRDAAGQLLPFTPKAWVPHSAHSPLNADPPPRFYDPNDPNATVTHFWFYGDGRIRQMCRMDKAAWANGALNRADGLTSPKALVREWYRTRRNPNYDTFSSEFTGYGESAPAGQVFSRPTNDQVDSFGRVMRWAQAEGWMPSALTPENMLLHGEISATACPDTRFDASWLITAIGQEDDMALSEDIIKAVFGTEARMRQLLANNAALEARVSALETNGDEPARARITELEKPHVHGATEVPDHKHWPLVVTTDHPDAGAVAR